MALAASLLLRQNQSLVMTPQLMQSIQLLQMTHFELNQFIAQEVEKNPLLEFSPNDAQGAGNEAMPEAGGDERDHASSDDGRGDGDGQADWYETGRADGGGHISDQIDANFENVFPDDMPQARPDAPELMGQWKSMPGGESGEPYDLDDFVAGRLSLHDHINQQIPLLVASSAERLIAQHLLDQLDDVGYLQADTNEISQRLGSSLAEVEAVLERLQTLDPPGIFARSLSECLGIQLRQKDRFDPAMRALVDHLELLAKRDFASLRKLCGVDEEDLVDMLAEIRQLNPKPGSGFDTGVSEAIVPDIVVRSGADGGWAIELNPDTLPKVLVNQTYFQTVSKTVAKQSNDQAFLSECMQNANWLTRSLDQRARTIMKVATEIVRQQDAFLVHGISHLRPLNLKTVAEAIKMHESTVSRVTSNKYMLTPRGLFELKYFFTVSISSAEGGDNHSAESVRHQIRKMIAQESPDAVLSDDDIVISLKKGGVDLARRTVAKYREAMNIPSSVQRRREKRAMAKVSAAG
ncbi:RNA polymerase factor sigma-54 [Rhizobiales bacterium RZME27]|uniref:RNA polymerase sigma-54 factor n=1 Tax=Endobacterium cereale TaxID=2663029 RepID=A0A6A8A589_9HYPH|nr:RNA polymerase factor sigma-54 [Endobacterium cereale]MEB2844823.1 RNA polymerase factor sigma-54 [Endobacterium cereale]MQY44740.1 RNA polymerase factor sigma-54 [Endobacterium cereale]